MRFQSVLFFFGALHAPSARGAPAPVCGKATSSPRRTTSNLIPLKAIQDNPDHDDPPTSSPPLQVVLVEPSPFNVDNLKKAIRKFQLAHLVTLLPYAAASRSGTAPFWDCSKGHSGAAGEVGSLAARNPSKKHCKSRIIVPVRTLDDIVAQVQLYDLHYFSASFFVFFL